MFLRALFLAVLVLAWLPASWAAQVYQWTDANGVKHYSNTPPPDGVTLDGVETEIAPDPDAARIKAEKEATVLRDADLEQQRQDEARRVKAEQDAARKVIDEKQAELDATAEEISRKRKYLGRHGRQKINAIDRLSKEITALENDPNADPVKIKRLEAERDAIKQKVYETPLRSRKGVRGDILEYQEQEKELNDLKRSQSVEENAPE